VTVVVVTVVVTQTVDLCNVSPFAQHQAFFISDQPMAQLSKPTLQSKITGQLQFTGQELNSPSPEVTGTPMLMVRRGNSPVVVPQSSQPVDGMAMLFPALALYQHPVKSFAKIQ